MKGTFAPKATDNNANRSDPARTDGIEVATAMKSIKSVASGKKFQKPMKATWIDSSISAGGALMNARRDSSSGLLRKIDKFYLVFYENCKLNRPLPITSRI
jgi:hypothetical protein